MELHMIKRKKPFEGARHSLDIETNFVSNGG